MGDLHGFLNPNDPVAISFWIISISMVAATVFFLMESTAVGVEWKTSLNVGALVTLVAAVHYFYMREFWIQIGTSPILYRYIDWSITVPLQMVEFYFILSEVFAGEAGKEAGNASGHVQSSYTIMKFIVSVGWSIYPAGYFFGYLIFNHSDDAALNLIYNLADFVNKIAFCLAIWQCAKAGTALKCK